MSDERASQPQPPPDAPPPRGRFQPDLPNDANLVNHEKGNENARASLAYLAAGLVVLATLVLWLLNR